MLINVLKFEKEIVMKKLRLLFMSAALWTGTSLADTCSGLAVIDGTSSGWSKYRTYHVVLFEYDIAGNQKIQLNKYAGVIPYNGKDTDMEHMTVMPYTLHHCKIGSEGKEGNSILTAAITGEREGANTWFTASKCTIRWSASGQRLLIGNMHFVEPERSDIVPSC